MLERGAKQSLNGAAASMIVECRGTRRLKRVANERENIK